MKRTKIIATLGPATSTKEKIEELYNAGVNIVRFNFSHANYIDAREKIKMINTLNLEGKTNLSLLLDTKGPEIRTGDLVEKNIYSTGDIFNIFIDKNIFLENNALYCDYPFLINDIELDGNIVIDSGLLSVRVIEKKSDRLVVEALNDAVIGSRRHINLPGITLQMPGVTAKDKQDIIFAIENNFSFIAASFIRSAANIQEIKDIFTEQNCETIQIISKVENQEAIDNIDEIVLASDGVMVARGDLGIEVPIQKLPIYQKEIVEKCNNNGKFVITATHLLETMINNPFPTRAESSDVFNSVLQKTDCLMLSGETAIGKFPIKSVEMMTSIIEEAEKFVDYQFNDYKSVNLNDRSLEKKLLIRSSLFISKKIDIKAIVIFTKSGLIARFTSAFRPDTPVFSFTPNEKTVKNSNILYGIHSYLLSNWNKNDYRKTMNSAITELLINNRVTKFDKIIAINDIQKDGKEFPMMEIIDLKNFK